MSIGFLMLSHNRSVPLFIPLPLGVLTCDVIIISMQFSQPVQESLIHDPVSPDTLLTISTKEFLVSQSGWQCYFPVGPPDQGFVLFEYLLFIRDPLMSQEIIQLLYFHYDHGLLIGIDPVWHEITTQ